MKGFTWSLHGSILTVLILWGYISAFNWILPHYVAAEVAARQEQEATVEEDAEVTEEPSLPEVSDEEIIERLKMLGMIVEEDGG